MSESVPSRRCSCCCEIRPLIRFRPRAGGRHRVCNECHTERERTRRAKAKQDKLRLFAAQVARERDTGRLQAATAAMLHLFGGPDRFAATLYAHFRAAPLGSQIAGNVLLAVARLWETVSPPPRDTSQATDEELERELSRWYIKRDCPAT